MRSVENYRRLAARSRRMAQTAVDPLVREQLQQSAADYDAMADKLEQTTARNPRTRIKRYEGNRTQGLPRIEVGWLIGATWKARHRQRD
jgi:hypothetical protein